MSLVDTTSSTSPGTAPASLDLLVIGAHLSGQPLNHQLTHVGGTLVETVRTASFYRLFALDPVPAKPGLLRVSAHGASIVGERWRIPTAGFGAVVAALRPPLTIGPVALADGEHVPGFLVEAVAVSSAVDITAYGGWLAYLAR